MVTKKNSCEVILRGYVDERYGSDNETNERTEAACNQITTCVGAMKRPAKQHTPDRDDNECRAK